nr:At2g33620/F4P9.39 [Arabidopsis thaliana]
MSGSETGLMAATRESMQFTMALHQQQQHSQAQPQQSQNRPLSFGGDDGTALYKQPMRSVSPPQQYQPNSAGENSVLNMNLPGGESGGMTGTGSEPVKKRRGRPRKYGPDSGEMSLGLNPGAPSFTVSQPSSGGDGGEKKRGRPPGSSSKRLKLQALGSTGIGFTPHVLTVLAGEDVSSKIMALTHNGPRAVCVLSANGAISNVTLRQPATSGGTVTYEGRFEILSLSGSFHLLENNGQRSRTGGLSVSLSSPDGNVLGGSVAGLLIAASPVQIVVGSFLPDGEKEPKQHVGQMGLSSPVLPRVAPTQVLMTPSSPQSRGTMSESSCGGGHGSPIHQSTGGPYNNTINMPWK